MRLSVTHRRTDRGQRDVLAVARPPAGLHEPSWAAKVACAAAYCFGRGGCWACDACPGGANRPGREPRGFTDMG
jgi:hypothetical protein